jgi:tetratricopeptide (TPR) repeat protein
MKKSILFILFTITLISCTEEKEVKLMPLTSKSDSAVKLMREYMENFEQRKWYDNEGVMDSILKLDPEFSMALAWWDPFLEREVRRTNIIKAYNNREGLSEFESLFIEGVYQRRVNGDIKKMDSILNQMITMYPDYYQLYGIAGDVKNNLNDPDASKVLWEKQLEINPNSFAAHENLAFLHFPTGNNFIMLEESKRDLDEAANLLNTLQKKYPSSHMPSRFLGNVYRAKSDFEKAGNAYQSALDIMDKSFDFDNEDQANEYGNSLLMMGHINTFQEKYDQARDYYQKAIDVSNEWWKVQISVLNSHTYLYQKDYGNAIFVLNDIYQQIENFESDEISKNNWRFFIEFSKFLAFGHSLNEEETLTSIENMGALRSTNMKIMKESADSETELQRLKIAEEANKLEMSVWYNILYGNYELANELLDDFKANREIAMGWNPNAMVDYHFLKGYNSLMEGDPEQALGNYTKIPNAVMDNDNYHRYFMALALKATGKEDESKQIMIKLANDNFATWQNSIVKNLAKSQIKTNI